VPDAADPAVATEPAPAAATAPALDLPAGLPASWTLRRPTPDDVDRVHALAASVDRAVLGWSD
jgi:hypothetical protein